MSDVPNDLTGDDYTRIITRDRFIKQELSQRVGALVQENLELMSIIQEIQQDLAVVRQNEAMLLASNGEAHDARIEAQNPGINLDEVHRLREEHQPTPPEGVRS